MKKRYLILALFCCTQLAAHPGTGIVKDSKDNIYYTDLSKVWKRTADGRTSVVVSGVHTHELFMDNRDNLFGEHLWYTGETSNRWLFYYWTLHADGLFQKLGRDTEGFNRPFSFARDSMGRHYDKRKWKDSYELYRTQKDGTVEVMGQGAFKEVTWLYCTEGGTLYFVDHDKVYQLKNGQIKLLAAHLIDKTPLFGWMDDRLSLYGLWTDAAENVYVAVLSGQTIKKITPDGSVSTIYQSKSDWSPIGGVFDSKGNLWVMETSKTNAVQVLKVEKAEIKKSEMPLSVVLPCLVVLLVVIAVSLFIENRRSTQPQ
ncbi:MAG: hypothetical protein JNL70_04680 [Saprospiraceae bacterium]|nr:hypothetical protein [Saprospiraceae bacterium]